MLDGESKMTRLDKIEYYLEIAKTVSLRSVCGRRKFGAILIKNDSIISTGYNGSIRGGLNCGTDVKCLKDIHNIPTMEGHDLCAAIHAEENTIINAARTGISTLDATLFLSGDRSERPCSRCRKMIIQAGIKDCYFFDAKTNSVVHEQVSEWINLENKWMRELERKD